MVIAKNPPIEKGEAVAHSMGTRLLPASTRLDDNAVAFLLHNEFYENEVIRAASYSFAERCSILMRPADDWEIEIVFEPITGINCSLETIAREFCNEVLDRQVRLDIEKRHGRTR
jgi:His-Xaa-Ser system protein HxsD